MVLLLLAAPALDPAVAHGGQDDQAHHEGDSSGDGLLKPEAKPLTPGKRYVEQTNPDAKGTMVVWQEKEFGRDWDIVAYNLSKDGPAFAVTISSVDEKNPVVHGPWIAWEEHNDAGVDVKVLNLHTGEEIRVPDTGTDDVGPTITGNTVYWLSIRSSGTGVLRGFDLVDRTMVYPAGNVTLISPPDAHDGKIAWFQEPKTASKLRVYDTRTGTVDSVPGSWNVIEGPELSRWGAAWIASVKGTQGGIYAHLYNLTDERLEPFRTGKYPHENLGACDSGIIWDQFTTNSELPLIALWDGFTEKTIEFSANNHDGTCAGDNLIYEKEVPAEDEDLEDTVRIYRLDLANARLPAKGEIRLDEGLEKGIYEQKTMFTGRLEVGDPREPLAGVWARVDGGELQPAYARPIGEGVYEWRFELDPSRYFNGQHTLNIVMVDDRGTETVQGFRFFTTGEYRTNEAVFDQGLNVPRESSSSFPFSLVDHYKDHQPFYNTVLLVLLILIFIVIMVYRYQKSKPPAPPTYVPPVEPSPEPDDGPEDGSGPVSFQQT